MKAYHFEHRVTFDETNLVGNVYFAHYAHWQGHCREHFLMDLAPAVLNELECGDLALATAQLSIDYIAECFAGDIIDIFMTRHAGTSHRITMHFEYRRNEEIVATGTQTVVAMRREGDRYVPSSLPDQMQQALAPYTTWD